MTTDYIDLLDEIAAEGAAEAIGTARLDPRADDHFFSMVREMDMEWDDDALRNHIEAMQRRAVIHDDPACMETAYVARALLDERARDAAIRCRDRFAVHMDGHAVYVSKPGRFSTQVATLTREQAWERACRLADQTGHYWSFPVYFVDNTDPRLRRRLVRDRNAQVVR